MVSLASYSFGQTFNVTPIELIRAQAACVNGGYLYQPYIVDQVLDDDGNVLSQHDSTPVRQVISEETSAIVREALEYVVSSGSGKNGRVAGYRIGGKTGTADKTGTRNTTREVVVSFMCFAPADDPQYIMLLTMDTLAVIPAPPCTAVPWWPPPPARSWARSFRRWVLNRITPPTNWRAPTPPCPMWWARAPRTRRQL